MGVFSWECKKCSLSILNNMIDNGQYSNATIILPNGSIVHGSYSGYGEVGNYKLEDCVTGDKAAFYHTSCWEELGKPTEYPGPSNHAEDQGHFIDERRYYGCPECGDMDCEECEECYTPSCICVCDEEEE